MADQVKDSLGRIIQADVAAIKDLLQNAKVGPPVLHNQANNTEKLVVIAEEMKKILEKIDDNFSKNANEAEKLLKELTSQSKKQVAASKSDDCCEKLLQAIKSMGKTEEGLLLEISKGQDKIAKANKALGGGGGMGGGSGGGGIGGNKIADAFDDAKYKKKLANVLNYFEIFGTKLIGGFSPISILMDGIVDKNIEFSNELKDMAWRVQGVTGEMTDLQSLWVDAADNWGQFNKLTGQSATSMQESFKKLSKKGLLKTQGDIAKVNKLMITSGSTATQLGANVESTTDLFGDWSMHLKLSETQLGQVGRHMRTIQSETGMAGDELLEVAKASESILKSLRDYGNLTTESAGAVLDVMARAKQLDLSNEMSEMLKPLQSFSDFISSDGPYRDGILAAAKTVPGLMDKVLSGTFMQDKKNLELLAQGRENLVNQVLSGQKTTDGKKATFENYDNLTTDARANVDNYMKQLTGNTLDQISRSDKVLRESAKSFTQKQADLTKQIKSIKGTDEASQKTKEGLMKKSRDLESSTAAGAISSIQDYIERGKTGRNESAFKTMEEMGVGGATDEEKMRNLFLQQAERIRQASGGKIDKTKLIAEGNFSDREVVKNMADELNKALTEQQTQESKDTNPMKSVANELQALNAFLTEKISPFLSGIGKGVIYFALIASALPSVVGSINLLVRSIFGFRTIISTLGKLWASRGAIAGAAGTGLRALLGTAAPAVAGSGFASMSGTMGAAAAGTAASGAVGTGAAGTAAAAGGGAALPVALAVAAITAAAGSLYGLAEASEKADLIFNKNKKDLTFAEQIGAENAGAFTGALNALTFGMFDCLEVTGSWTKAIAKFFADWPILGAILNATLLPAKMLIGILKGIWRFLKGTFVAIWEAIQIAIEPLVEVGNELWASFTDLIKPITSLFDSTSGGIGIIEGLAKAGEWAAKIIGFVIKGIAKLISWILRFSIWLVKLFVAPHKALKEAFNFFKNINWESIGSGLLNGLKAVFISFPIWLGTKIKDGLKAIFIDFPIWLGTKLKDGLKSTFIDFPIWLGTKVKDGFMALGAAIEETINRVVTFFEAVLKAVFIEFPTWLCGKIKEALGGIVDWVLNKLPGGAEKAAAAHSGFSADAQTQWDEWQNSGSEASTMHALGGLAGGAGDILTGDFLQGAGKMGAGTLELGEEVLDNIAGIFGFADGSKEITKDGIARIHKGEIVVPENVASGLRAESSGDWASGFGSGLEGLFSPILDYASELFNSIAAPAATAVSKPITDVYSRVREQNASKTAGLSRSAELEKIDEVSEKQLERLISIDENIKELVALMGPSQLVGTSLAPHQESAGQRHNLNTPDYAQWPLSLTQLGMGNKQVHSDGVVT